MTSWTSPLPLVFVIGMAGSGVRIIAETLANTLKTELMDLSSPIGALSILNDAAKDYGRLLANAADSYRFDAMRQAAAISAVVLQEHFWQHDNAPVVCAGDFLSAAPCLRAVPILAKFIPNAHFVCVEQEGVAYVAERQRMQPRSDFHDNCVLWSACNRESTALKREISPDRLVFVEYEEIFSNPESIFKRMSRFLYPDDEAAFKNHLQALTQQSSCLRANAGSLKLSHAGWSLAEKRLFADICGEGMTNAGCNLDMDEVIRSRPLRIREIILQGDPIIIGESGKVSRSKNGAKGVEVFWEKEDEKCAAIITPALSLNGRTELGVRASAAPQEGPPVKLRVDVVETLSRRRLCEVEQVLGRIPKDLTATIAPTHNLVDVIISVSPINCVQSFGLGISRAIIGNSQQ